MKFLEHINKHRKWYLLGIGVAWLVVALFVPFVSIRFAKGFHHTSIIEMTKFAFAWDFSSFIPFVIIHFLLIIIYPILLFKKIHMSIIPLILFLFATIAEIIFENTKISNSFCPSFLFFIILAMIGVYIVLFAFLRKSKTLKQQKVEELEEREK